MPAKSAAEAEVFDWSPVQAIPAQHEVRLQALVGRVCESGTKVIPVQVLLPKPAYLYAATVLG